jgi:hypothetical protein
MNKGLGTFGVTYYSSSAPGGPIGTYDNALVAMKDVAINRSHGLCLVPIKPGKAKFSYVKFTEGPFKNMQFRVGDNCGDRTSCVDIYVGTSFN